MHSIGTPSDKYIYIYIWDKYIREFISHCVSLASKVPLKEAEIASTVFQPVLQLTHGHMAEAWPI